jgi:phosphate uptake regulator
MSVNLQSRVIDLRRNLLALGAVVEQRVMNVIDVIRDGDVELARIARSGDAEIDQMQLDLEAECMRLLALGSPVAGDLRLILTAMRVSNELERIADMAKGISKRVIRLVDSGNYRYPSSLVQMAEAALNMLLQTAAIEAARTRPLAVFAALQPGPVASKLSGPFVAAADALTTAASAAGMLAALDALQPTGRAQFVDYRGGMIPW